MSELSSRFIHNPDMLSYSVRTSQEVPNVITGRVRHQCQTQNEALTGHKNTTYDIKKTACKNGN